MGGFYKVVNSELLNAQTRVHSPSYTLLLKNKGDAVLPDGWKWFDTDDLAYTFFAASVDRVKIMLNEINMLTYDETEKKKLSDLSTVLGKGALTAK